MATIPQAESLKKLLSKTVATICKEMIDFDVRITIDGLLSVVVDDTKVVNVCVQERISKRDLPRTEGQVQCTYTGDVLTTSDQSSQASSTTRARPSKDLPEAKRPCVRQHHKTGDSRTEQGYGQEGCIIKNFGSSLVASVAPMTEAFSSRLTRKPCCAESVSNISKLADGTWQDPIQPATSSMSVPLAHPAGPVTAIEA